MPRYTIEVNGKKREIDAPEDMPLLWVLRDRLGLTGTKYGCGAGICGSCTVHIGGEAARSCQTAISAIGRVMRPTSSARWLDALPSSARFFTPCTIAARRK